MMKKVNITKYSSLIWLLVAVALLLLTFTIHGSLKETNVEESMAVNEVITETIEEETVKTENTETELVESTNEVAVASAKIVEDPYSIVETEIEALKNKDATMVNKYFGESTVFTADAIADRLTATVVSFVSSKEIENNQEIVVHICTLDYDKMNEAAKEIKSSIETEAEESDGATTEEIANTTNKEVAKGVVSGDFDLHYNIPIRIENGSVVVTEELKQAITGNWYKGVNITLESVECHLEKK